jgi:hypothetical protein
MQDYQKLNKDLWNKWANLHSNTAFYDVEGFKKGKSSLNQTELDILGDVKGQESASSTMSFRSRYLILS